MNKSSSINSSKGKQSNIGKRGQNKQRAGWENVEEEKRFVKGDKDSNIPPYKRHRTSELIKKEMKNFRESINSTGFKRGKAADKYLRK